MKKPAIIFGSALIGTLLVGAFLMVGLAQAANSSLPTGYGGHWSGASGGAAGPRMTPGVFGTVSAISGDTLTVTSRGFGGFGHSTSTSPTPTSATTTYTVDATNATVSKNGTSSTVSAISVGDNVMIRGTVNGTSVTATSIMDGIPQGGPGMMMHRGPGSSTSTPSGTSLFEGNGEPVVGGTVSTISGSTFTLTNKSNVTYTVDATNATVVKGNVTSSLSNVAVNDNVLVQGTVNGTSVTASSILDQGAPRTSGTSTGAGMPGGSFVGKMFGGIGAFFQHIFGFF